MKLPVLACAISVAVALSGCAAPPAPKPVVAAPLLPPDIGNGIGSQFGNYGGKLAGDAKGPAGQHCVVFNWDRPLNKDFAIRYSSLSCDQAGKEWKTTTTYTRSIVPISQSTFAQAEDQPSQ
jgi:hypothetical protein